MTPTPAPKGPTRVPPPLPVTTMALPHPAPHDPSDAERANRSGGWVSFVGAGPGHPDLLTIRGLERLRAADCVLHDALVPRTFLEVLAPHAEWIPVTREGSNGDPGESIGLLLLELVRSGRRVVRLKGGDPSVFARLAEETLPLRQAGIAFETVPGVTAALAAAAAAGIPLTSRASSSSLTFVTGHDAQEKDSPLDIGALASLPGTLVVYMGVASAPRWAAGLLAAGRGPDTPVAIVGQVSRPDERIARTTLAGLADAKDSPAFGTPAVAVVGDVAAVTPIPAEDVDDGATAASHHPPLAGRVVLVTRPEGQGGTIEPAVGALGGRCLHVPVVRVGPPRTWAPLDAAIAEAGSFDWIVFASVNGARGFQERLRARRGDARLLGTARVAAIGPATAAALEAVGIIPDLIPADSNSEGMAAALIPTMRRGRVLLVGAERGRDVMRRLLGEAGHAVTEVAAYATVPVERLDEPSRRLLEARPVDWVTVTSGSIAESAVRLFGSRMRSWRVASISPVTSRVLQSLGYPPDCEAETPTTAALVQAIASVESRRATAVPGVVPRDPSRS